jgi:predicted DNA-binding transcriptional regulator AlpA
MYEFNPEKLIDWSELSRLYGYNRSSITRKRIPDQFKSEIELLKSKIKEWYNERNGLI